MKVYIPIDEKRFDFKELAKYTNPVLIRLGKKPIVSYIIEMYPIGTEFIISTDYFVDHLKDFVSLVYPNIKFTFIGSEQTSDSLQFPHIHHHSDLVIDKRYPNIFFKVNDMKSLLQVREMIHDKFDNLDKVDESLFFFKDFAIKFFADEKKILARVERGKLLGGLVPETLEIKKNFYKYSYIKGDTYSNVANPKNFKNFLNWASIKLWKSKKTVPVEEFKKICLDFYEKKTKERVNKFMSVNKIVDRKMTINGKKVPDINTLLSKVNFDNLSNGVQTQFHGDFILENVILNKNKYTLLDWRQDFGGLLKTGDMYYDLAKLYHNLVVNHDIVTQNRFAIKIKGNSVTCSIDRKPHLVECEKTFDEFIISKGNDLNKIKILRAIIWLNMSPLHHYPFNIFLFYFGKYNLYKALNEK